MTGRVRGTPEGKAAFLRARVARRPKAEEVPKKYIVVKSTSGPGLKPLVSGRVFTGLKPCAPSEE